MQELRQSTEIKVRIGSAVDATDGVTPETGLTLGAADQAEVLKHNGAATADISASTFAAVTAVDGWYDLTLTAGNTDTLGQITVVIQDSSLMVPIFRDFMVVTANYWDSKYSTDIRHADVTQCGGSAVAAGAIPNAAADAAGGLPISDAGGLDLDTKLANTNEVTAARMGALTDWINGGRLDLLLDAIPTTAMRGTDGANTTVPDAAGVAATPAEVATALANIHLDHLLAVEYDPASKPGVATALWNELIENDGGVSRYTANALEQAPSGGTNPNVLIDTTIASVTDQTHFTLTAGSNDDDAYKDQAFVVYDASDSDFPSVRVCSAYTGATKTVTLDSAPDFTIVTGDGAKAFVTAPGTTAPTVGQVRAEMEGAGYFLDLIKDDTNELQTDWVNGGRLDTLLDAIPTTAMRGTDNAALATTALSTATWTAARAGALTDWINGGRLDLIIDLILEDTAELQGNQAAWATATGFSTHSAADIWSVVTRALTDKSGFALSAAGANLILKDSTFALAMADAIWDEILSGVTHNIASSAGRRVREIGAYAIHAGTAQAGNSHTITIAAEATPANAAYDGIFNRNLIVLTDNTGAGQTRTIIDYDAVTKVIVVDRDWRISPDNTTTYQITPDDTPLVVDQGVAQAGTATTITLREYASSSNDAYLCSVVAIIGGTGRGQARLVGGYVGATKVVTICGDDWVTTPDATSVYVLMPYGTTCTSCIGTHALGLINAEVKDCLTIDQIADSYATDGAQPTIAQGILAIHQMLQEKSISGTTLTVKKPDGSTVAMTFTLDSATAPTSITRAT